MQNAIIKTLIIDEPSFTDEMLKNILLGICQQGKALAAQQQELFKDSNVKKAAATSPFTQIVYLNGELSTQAVELLYEIFPK